MRSVKGLPTYFFHIAAVHSAFLLTNCERGTTADAEGEGLDNSLLTANCERGTPAAA